MVWQEDLRAVWSDLSYGVHIWQKGCVVEGHRAVLSYTPTAVRVRCKKGVVLVEGESLSILSLSKDEVYIAGVVHSVRRE